MADKLTLLKADLTLKGLSVPEISENFTQTDFYNKAAEALQMTQAEMTNYLWATYHPNRIWIVLIAIGGGAAFLLFFGRQVFDTKSRKIVISPLSNTNDE
ncbi:MAG: hypothetical protein MZV63_30840 [Marinilabiliales bacterium]|nr:hypothetical protein [Marinilabiliales bacterium]